ncbi:DUF748 domain-containing protein [Nitrosomonas sp. JL21]|uniref:DUF748 domain-containing protein n=1 Tax=Nitrosomonas sp. JL21 TaxID=153949 RepID=UPI00136F5CC9|nr:DUF748 domain-containing protein [Nitrosomonas sp. JL21]MBL8497263.1 DUF748 domain-containing protein [Nitrosomonas sp.]MCC7091170.1 DUF748 domain-containing protein [Nitrosomonas sp.]MXS77132.1 DUF748 domain-containing protein [Nitrosomonas sp. JL21]
MTTTVRQRFISHKRLIISVGVIAALILLIAALSYFWLPGYAKSQIEERLSEMLQRPVSVAKIEIKPHTLELIVQDFRIGNRIDEPEKTESLFSFAKLHIDVSIESITRRAPVVTAFSIVEPRLHIVREAEDRFNFSDLLEKFSQPADDSPKEKGSAQFSISNIVIQGGHFGFDDQYKKADHQISDINLGIPIIANFESTLTSWIEPHFSAKINGSPLKLDGKLRPFTDKQEATLAIKLTELDLMELNHYVPFPKGIQLRSGFFESDWMITFSQAHEQTPEITLTGNSALRRLALKNDAVEVPYQASLKHMRAELKKIDLTGKAPSHIQLVIDQAAILPDNAKEPALSLAELEIDQIIIDNAAHKIELDDITLNRLRTTLRRDATGAIDLTRLFNPKDGKTPVEAQQSPRSKNTARAPGKIKLAKAPIPARKPDPRSAAVKPDPAPQVVEEASGEKKSPVPNDSPWVAQIKRVNLKAASVRYDDMTLTKTPPMVIDPLDIMVENIDLSGKKPLNMTINARVNERGRMKVNGALAWAPLMTDLVLDLDSVDLVSLQGWAGGKLKALITSGDVSFVGKLKAQDGDPLKLLVNGEAKLYNLNVFDPNIAQDLFRWKKMDVSGLNVTTDPMRVDIKTIQFSDFFARMTLLPSGELNLVHIVQIDQPLEVDVAPAGNKNAVEVKVTTPDIEPVNVYQVKPQEETFIQIGKVILQNGNINFHDRFIKPNYRANLTGLKGQIGPLYPGKFGVIDIHGALDKTAPLQIKGKIEPFSSEFFLDLAVNVKDIDLPQFSPYSGKYVGYEIEKGKLSADVQYHVEKGALTAENKIFLDQFTLGDKVESESAVSLPLDLALTILKNRRGEINLHLPLSGSINDPEFDIGALVFKAFVNLITKAITAPFALLASAFEGGEELSEISFTPGFAEIDEAAAKRLETLAEILNDRPSLDLEISGHADAAEDHEGLKLAILQDKVKAQKLAEQTKKGIASGAIEDLKLTPEEYQKYLEAVYKKESFEKPKNAIGLTKSLPVPEMERLILEHLQINESDLAGLAERRATAARNWLVETGKIPDERIFIVGSHESEESEQKTGNRAEFLLK